MNDSDRQNSVTRALACLCAAEWHNYSPQQLYPIWREVVSLVWSHANKYQRKFLQRYGELLKANAVPNFPLMLEVFPPGERMWLIHIYQDEPVVGNAIYYARRLHPESSEIVKYDLWDEEERDDDETSFTVG